MLRLVALGACLAALACGSGGDDGDGAPSTDPPVGDAGGAAAADGAGGDGDAAASGAADGTRGGDGAAGAGGTGEGSDDSGASGAAGSGAEDGTTGDGSATPEPVVTPTPEDASLATATGCAGPFNPDQLLDLSLTMSYAYWASVLVDSSYTYFASAQMRCGDEPPLTVGVRRKRSGGAQKVGLKVDINQIVAGQKWYGLKKLSLENGVSEGTDVDGAGVEVYVAEYLAWRLMVLSGAISGRAAFVRLTVNGELVGVYVNIEQVDKRFLKAQLGDDSGWLYKKSGGIADGLKTHEVDGLVDPYADYFCFFLSGGQACAVPPDAALLQELPAKLDIPQLLRMGAVNAIMANTDSPLFKDNNYYWYDYDGGPRVYIPWDLDTAMNADMSLYAGGGGAKALYDDVLFTHWRDDYDAIIAELMADQLSAEVIEAELQRALEVAGAALDADPYATGSAADAVADLSAWWTQRRADVLAELP